MIAAAREWLTGLITVTMLLSVAQTLIPEGRLRRTGSFVGGLILLVVLLQPLMGMDLSRVDLRLERYEAEIARRQAELAEAGNQELASIIESRTAAYIWDKADALGLSVAVRVETRPGEGGIPVPWRAEITGPYAEALAAYMEGELGIPRERQVWQDEEN